MWKCDEQVLGGGVCTKASHRREVFGRHLEYEHGVESRVERDAREERCRVDRHSNTRFWCGFCEDVVEVAARKGNGVWGERYDHVGNHFTGGGGREKRDISEWSCGDADLSDGDAEMADRRPEGADLAGALGKRKREGSVDGDAREAKKMWELR